MAKLTLTDIANLQNETTVVNAINNNNNAVEAALENTLSRNGSVPNQMFSSLDMNSNRIINLPTPVSLTEAARLQDIGNAPGFATAAAASATASAASAVTSGNFATNSSISATNANNSAIAASASATAAQGYVTGLSGTSTTSVTIGTGSKSFTTQTGKLWVAGQTLTVSSNSNPSNYMHGSVTSYDANTGALVLNVLDIGGSGTIAVWNITISGSQGSLGPQGPAGATGVSGTPTVNQFATFLNASTVQGVSITGLVKGNGASAPTAAVSATDYAPATTGTSILKASSGGFANAVSGTDYQAPIGTISGIAKGNGANALTAAVAGTDYLSPAAIGTTVQAYDSALFSNIPQNSQSAAYTLVLSDAQKHIYHPSADTTARIWTIPANASVAYPIGAAVTFVNDTSGGVITISINTDTLVLAGAGTTGSRTLAANGVATAIKITSTRWIISGTNLT